MSHVEELVVPLKNLIEKTLKTISKKIKEGQSGTDVERLNDLMRSCLRSFLALDGIESIKEGAAISKTYALLKDLISTNERLMGLVDAITSES